MAFNGSGLFVRLYNWVQDRDNAININASRMDAEMDGIATGLSTCLTKDGQNAATANQPMGTFRHTGVGNASARTDYAAAGQVQDGSFIWCGTAGGTGDAITLTPTPAITAYAAGQTFRFIASTNNTGATTVNVSGLGAKSITKLSTAALTSNEIKSGGSVTEITYDGTQFQLKNVPSIGSKNIYIPVHLMKPSATGGCAAQATIATSANHPDVSSLDFDTTTQEFAQFSIAMPKSWNRSTITAQFHWSHAATVTNFSCLWGLQALAVSDDDTIDAAFGTAGEVLDTGGTTNDLYITAGTSAITIAGTPASQDMVFFRVYRDPAQDNLGIDARLHGIVISIGLQSAIDN